MSRILYCPHCGMTVDGSLNVDGRPEPRDWMPILCSNCAEISTVDFFVIGGLRETTTADWKIWGEDPGLARKLDAAIAAAALMKGHRHDEGSVPPTGTH